MRDFLPIWNLAMYAGAVLSVLVGLGKFFVYESKKKSLTQLKDRYDFMTDNEVKTLQFSLIAFCLALFLLVNTTFSDQIAAKGAIWFGGRMFLGVLASLMVGFAASTVLNVQFIASLEKRLDALRNKPRECNDCKAEGRHQLMRKLSEEEEDDYLDEHQIAEESDTGQHSADYDVWLCPEYAGVTDNRNVKHKRVEKYFSYLHAVECPKCNNFTMKIAREEVTHTPTAWQTGQLTRFYRCNLCGHRERKTLELSRLQHNTTGSMYGKPEVH